MGICCTVIGAFSSNAQAWQASAAPIYPTAAQWADSLQNVPQTIGGLTFPQVNSHARLLINVPAGTTSLGVWLANTLINSVFFFDGSVGVFVDGVFTTSWNAVGAAQVIQLYTLALDGNPHQVAIWSGYQSTLLGTYVYAVQGTGISIATAPAASRRTCFYGDSILEGGASTPNPQFCYFALLRGILPAGMAISQEAWGARSLWDDVAGGNVGTKQGFADVSLLAARLVGLVAGAATREIWLAMGYNDANAGHWADAPTFGVAYGTLLDAIHTADPGCHVYAGSLITASLDLSAYRSAIATQVSTRTAFCSYVDGLTLMLSSGLSADNTHPANVGHQAIALGTGASAGTSSIRTVLGI